jgi:hypothetical protein
MTIRVNLFTNPSIENSVVSDHSGIAVTIAASSTQAWHGTKSMKVTYTTTGTGNGYATIPIALEAATAYTLSRYVYVPTGTVPVRLSVQAGGFTTQDSATSSVNDGWQRLSVTFTTTTAQSYNLLLLNDAGSSMTSGTFYYTDGFLLEKGAILGAYFDGSTVNAGFTCGWLGIANEAKSYEILGTGGRLNRFPQPSMEGGIGTWTYVQASGSKSTDHAYAGTNSLKIVCNGSQNAYNAGAALQNVPLTIGVTHTASCYVWVPTGAPAVSMVIKGTGMTNAHGNPSTLYDQWQRISVTFASTVTPGSLPTIWIYNNTTTPGGGSTFYMDAAMLELGFSDGRTNLLTNPSCETNTTGWSNVNGSVLSSSADHAWTGTKSQKVVYDGTARASEQTGTSVAAYPFTSGSTYTFSAYVWVPTGQPAVKIKYGGATFNVTGTTSTLNDQWERLSVTTTAGSTNTAYLYILNAATSVPNATGFYVDGAMLEANSSPALGVYFDGDTADAGGYVYDWSGAAHASTSTYGRALDPYFDGSTTAAGYAIAWLGTDHESESYSVLSATITIKSREAGAWVPRTAVPKVRVAGAWVSKRPKRWNGSAWVDLA